MGGFSLVSGAFLWIIFTINSGIEISSEITLGTVLFFTGINSLITGIKELGKGDRQK